MPDEAASLIFVCKYAVRVVFRVEFSLFIVSILSNIINESSAWWLQTRYRLVVICFAASLLASRFLVRRMSSKSHQDRVTSGRVLDLLDSVAFFAYTYISGTV